jgi:hypothetical protein
VFEDARARVELPPSIPICGDNENASQLFMCFIPNKSEG